MKAIRILRVATSLLAATPAVHAAGCLQPKPDAVAFENEPFVRIPIYRYPGTNANRIETIEYDTTDIDAETYASSQSALAGVHYVASRGSVTFAAGQMVAGVDVRLIDNSVVDGSKDFSVVLRETNGAPIHSGLWIRIHDNEISRRVDGAFVPDVSFWPNSFHPMPDGRVLVWDSADWPGHWRMLRRDGRLDHSFSIAEVEAKSEFGSYGSMIGVLRVLDDGKILVRSYNSHLLRLLPNGEVDARLSANWGAIAGVQSDGKILAYPSALNTTNVLSLERFHQDGSQDADFHPVNMRMIRSSSLPQILLQPDDKIVIGGSFDCFNDAPSRGLVRLNYNGSLDNTFAPPSIPGQISLVSSANGKLLVWSAVENTNSGAWTTVAVRLEIDGTLDPEFHVVQGEADQLFSGRILEQPDGRLLVAGGSHRPYLIRFNADGSPDPSFSLRFDPVPPFCQGVAPPAIAMTRDGRILFAGRFDRVEDIERPGFVAIYAEMPPPEFRVVIPARFFRSSREARLQIVRTGDTALAGSVTFTTREDTALAGKDFIPQSGILDFAPLEVSKEVIVPLLTSAGAFPGVAFRLELSKPSPGYAVADPASVVILPDLRLTLGRPLFPKAVARLQLHGVQRGVTYRLEISENLSTWATMSEFWSDGGTLRWSDVCCGTLGTEALTADGGILDFHWHYAWPRQFFRAVLR